MSRKKNSKSQSAEQQPTEQQPTEQQPTEQQSTEQQPTEQQPTEQQSTEQQSTEQQPTEQQPTEQQPTEQQPTEQQQPDGNISPSDFIAEIEKSIEKKKSQEEGGGNEKSDSEPILKFEKKTRRGRKRKKPIQILSGEGLLSLIDMVIPRLISYGVELGTGKSIPVSGIQLDEREKKELEKIADEAAARLALSGDPVAVLAVALLTTYGAKTVANTI